MKFWYQVQGIQAPVFLNLCGYVYPDFGGPTNSLLQIKLEAQDGKTLLKLCDGIVGHISDTTYESARSGWIALFEEGLKK